MDPIMGQIMIFAGNFAPNGWAFCQGQLMSINQNSALFSVLGTTYGGDGRTNFALPDLRGRAPVGTGQGRGLAEVSLGAADADSAAGMSDGATASMRPTLGLTFIIALVGTYPARSD